MIKKLLFIACMIVCFIIGLEFGLIFHSKITISEYNLGRMSFCELNEDLRLKVCPYARFSKDIKNNNSIGNITMYVCDANRLYIETNNIDKDISNELIKLYQPKKVISVCNTDISKIYEVANE